MIPHSLQIQLASKHTGMPQTSIRRRWSRLAEMGLCFEPPIGRPLVGRLSPAEMKETAGGMVNKLLALGALDNASAPTHVATLRQMVPYNEGASRYFLEGDTLAEALEYYLDDGVTGVHQPLDIAIHRHGGLLRAVTLTGSLAGKEVCKYVPEEKLPPVPRGAVLYTCEILHPLIDLFAMIWVKNRQGMERMKRAA